MNYEKKEFELVAIFVQKCAIAKIINKKVSNQFFN